MRAISPASLGRLQLCSKPAPRLQRGAWISVLPARLSGITVEDPFAAYSCSVASNLLNTADRYAAERLNLPIGLTRAVTSPSTPFNSALPAFWMPATPWVMQVGQVPIDSS